ncbi:MAG: DUF6653 family protein [Pseudomonadota bacterium]
MNSLARAFAMTDAVWERHTNPWSFWTRLPILPLIALAIWSRGWIGVWCLIPVAGLLIWTWLNPRAFPAPTRTGSWYARAVIGERIWLESKRVPIPQHHAAWAGGLSLAALAGVPPLAWGLLEYDAFAVLLGLCLAILPKLWFLDRMVWLTDDVAPRHPQYAAWLR